MPLFDLRSLCAYAVALFALHGSASVLLATSALGEAKKVPFPDAWSGDYVIALASASERRCSDSEGADDDEDYIQKLRMKLTSDQLSYSGPGVHVTCHINRVSRQTTKNHVPGFEYVGPWLRPQEPVYAFDVECIDDAVVGKHRLMSRLVEIGEKTVFLETNLRTGVTEAWVKCTK